MKQITVTLVLACMLVSVCKIEMDKVIAEEVVIESVREKEENLWDSRPLIQTTTFEEEYAGVVSLGACIMPICDGKDKQSLYDAASRCVVRIEMGQYAGSGLIWCMEEEGMVIAANKHLLRESAYGMVTFINGMDLQAEIMGYSQEYDLGFLLIRREELTSEILRDCYEIRRTDGAVEEIEDQSIMQIASSQQGAGDYYEGNIRGITFVPEFQAFMLETECYAKAGMSGGGVFDEKGCLLGMIAGGAVTEYDFVRESDVTYSIQAQDIATEYERMKVGY